MRPDTGWVSRILRRTPRGAERVADDHRERVGGLWSEIGELQFRFLVERGLRPEHRLLDVGCGAFRGGIHFLRYLEPGNYFGIDVDRELIDAGLRREVAPAGLLDRLPARNILVSGLFEASRFGVTFDFALAQSLFTHLAANQVRRCLIEIARVMEPGGSFYGTYFECPEGHPEERPLTHVPGQITTRMDSDPFHYSFEAITGFAKGLPWLVERVPGSWEHPRSQRMLRFTRTG